MLRIQRSKFSFNIKAPASKIKNNPAFRPLPYMLLNVTIYPENSLIIPFRQLPSASQGKLSSADFNEAVAVAILIGHV